VGVAAKATDLKVPVPGVQGIADGRRRLGRSLVAEHPVIPGLNREPVGHLARFLGALRRIADRLAVDDLS
jgi:hypothetical protein